MLGRGRRVDILKGNRSVEEIGDYRQTSYRGPRISRRLGMLADLTKCVLTLLSSPAPGGGPGSQGLRAQQGWVSAAEGQPQTSLGVDGKIKKRQRIAPLHNQHICWGLLTRVGHKGWPIYSSKLIDGVPSTERGP